MSDDIELVTLRIFSRIVIIIRPNLIKIFIRLDLTSYCLVIFYQYVSYIIQSWFYVIELKILVD